MSAVVSALAGAPMQLSLAQRVCIVDQDWLSAYECLRSGLHRMRPLLCKVLGLLLDISFVPFKRWTHTDCVASSVLHREFEHGGVLHGDDLDGENSMAEAIGPG